MTSVGYSIEYYDARNNKYQVHSTRFGRHTRPSSGVQCSTVSTATGTNHSISTDRHSYFLPVWPGTGIEILVHIGYVAGWTEYVVLTKL